MFSSSSQNTIVNCAHCLELASPAAYLEEATGRPQFHAAYIQGKKIGIEGQVPCPQGAK